MTTGQTDVLVVPREPQANGNGPILVTETTKAPDTTSGPNTRSRKKVTFDLDLQVRTIPNRIPVYERKPAHYTNPSHSARGRASQSYAFVPKPLDIRGRDRYLIGAANLSAKKIVDLFRVPNGHQSYPSPPKGQARQGQPTWRKQSQQGYGSAATSGSSAVRHPAYAYDGTKSAKMSRAAANLKQITAALSEQFDASVYQEWTSQGPAKKGPTPVTASIQGIGSPDISSGSGTCNNPMSPTQPRGFNPTKAKSHLQFRQQLSPQSISPTDSNQDSESSRTSVIDRTRPMDYSPGAATSTMTRKLPVVVTDQSSFSDSQLIISKAPSNQRPDLRRRISDDGASERFRRVPSAKTDRSLSRCSTIDSFVISEPYESESSPASGSFPKGRSIGSGKKVTSSPGAVRPMAWEGAELSVTEPNLMVNALRTVKHGQANTSLNNPHWQVSSKTINR